ncbi:unnamed protein product [Rotaria magnacalcarata]|uniref:NAD(P)(+)--arginine ADP-ribosyltransferase n=3 Tax=Rotaria magnacalcarata TaxID=392030 RepID=A0A816TN80_9BILA|nr:unnamed protein product [Rotaria magnacalcarata]CAF4058504.1 unnamed protein product [Rotaria magnacalcarata]
MSSTGQRFTDVEIENKRLPACYGYITSALVSLDEAMGYVRALLPQIDRFVTLAKRHGVFPNEHNLSKDEAASVYLYTMEISEEASVYSVLNRTLRADDRSQVRPWFAYLKLLDSAASKLPNFKGTVWRGVNRDVSETFKRGERITWWSVSSCSTSMDIISSFLGTNPQSTLFNIECATGKSIAMYTCYPNENEVILMPGTMFEVMSNPLHHPGGLHVIHLKEITDDEEHEATKPATAVASAPISDIDSITDVCQTNVDNTHYEISCLIWLDANVNAKETRDTESKLGSIITHFKKFPDVAQCRKYIEEQSQKDQLVIIVSGHLGQELVPSVYQLQQVVSFYVYCMNKKFNEQWACKFTKVRGVVVDIDELISRIKTDHKIQKMMKEPLSMNAISRSTITEKLGHVVDDDVLKLAKNEIIHVLQLEDDESKDEIVHDLMENGRQSLSKYEDDLLPGIYTAAINENDGDFMKSLKYYFEQQWKVQYGSNEWFILFLKKHKDSQNYQCVMNRAAEYGNKYMKNCPILSIVLQLVFEGIDDQCLTELNVFNDLWLTITNDGLKSIEKYSDYVAKDLLDTIIEKKQLVLFQALREYYRPQLFQLLKESKINNTDNLYEFALDNVAEYGWLTGLQKLQNKIVPKYFKTLLAKTPIPPKVEAHKPENDQSCIAGQDTYISWKFSGIEKPRVTETNDGTSELSIHQAELADQGIYTAMATNSVGKAEAKTTLFIIIKPMITVNLDGSLQATKDETMTLKIVASGTPKPDIVWMKGSNEIKPNDRVHETKENHDDDDYIYTLVISHVEPEDQGEYSAKISNIGESLVSNKCKVTVSSTSS